MNFLQVLPWAMRSEQESCGRRRHHEPHESVLCRSSGQHLGPFTVAHLALTDRAFVLCHCGWPVLCHCCFTLVGTCHGFVLFGIEMKTKRSCGIKNEIFNDAWYYTWVPAVPPKLISDLVPSALTCVFFALVVQASSASAQLKYVQVSFHFPYTPKSQLYIFVSVAQ